MSPRLLVAWVICLAGCAGPRISGPASPPSEDGEILLAVPFFPDRGDQCGPSALASVLRFWGEQADPGRLKDEIYQGRLKGSLNVDLLLAAESHGMSAEMLEGNLAKVKQELDLGHPLIAFVNVGLRSYPVGHYMVITGYNDRLRGLYAHSGAQRNAFVPYKRFYKQWDKTERWALLILPPAR